MNKWDKFLDGISTILAAVFLIWMFLAFLYYTVPYMKEWLF